MKKSFAKLQAFADARKDCPRIFSEFQMLYGVRRDLQQRAGSPRRLGDARLYTFWRRVVSLLHAPAGGASSQRVLHRSAPCCEHELENKAEILRIENRRWSGGRLVRPVFRTCERSRRYSTDEASGSSTTDGRLLALIRLNEWQGRRLAPAVPSSSAGASGNLVAPRIISRSWSENTLLKSIQESMICSRCCGGIPRRSWIAVPTARWRPGGRARIWPKICRA